MSCNCYFLGVSIRDSSLGAYRTIKAVRLSLQAASRFQSTPTQWLCIFREYPFYRAVAVDRCTTRLERKTVPFQEMLCVETRNARTALTTNLYGVVHTSMFGEDQLSAFAFLQPCSKTSREDGSHTKGPLALHISTPRYSCPTTLVVSLRRLGLSGISMRR
jgi:hypothetical protein